MGGKTATSSSSVSIPPEVLARYNSINARAENAANNPFKRYGNQASDFVAQINPQQMAGISGINAAANSYQPYMSSALTATNAGMGAADLGGLDINKYLSPYLSQVQGSTAALMNQANEQAQSGALGAAASSGAFGGDRAGIAAANLNQQNQLAMGKTMADIANQGYNVAAGIAQGQQAADLAARQANLARQMQGGAQLAGLGAQTQQLGLQGAQAQIGAGTLQQQTEQAGKDAMVQQFMQEQGYPFQVAQFLANIAMGTGSLSGSTTTSTSPRNWLGFASGGGVSGPMSASQQPIGGAGYVPEGNLPVGGLMIAEAPQMEKKGSSIGDVLKLMQAAGGMASGGVAGNRKGYYDGGFPRGLTSNGPEMPTEAWDTPIRSGEIPTGEEWDIAKNRGLAARPTMPETWHPQMPTEAWDTPIRSGQTPAGGVVPNARPNLNFEEAWDVPVRSGQPPMLNSPRPMPGPAGQAALNLAAARPQPRPAGLGAAQVAPAPTADLGASGSDVVPARPSSDMMVDTGKIPSGNLASAVPLDKQLGYMWQELQSPQYNRFLKSQFATPGDAAISFRSIYEGAAPDADRMRISYANDVYRAAQSGDLSKLPENAQTAYNFLIQQGATPVQAAGAVGNLMVESYSRVDPNAFNPDDKGGVSFGIAQWHDPARLNGLLEYAGVDPSVLRGMPASTPEGRYYSTGVGSNDGGLGAANINAPAQQGSPGIFGSSKPWDQRNFIGKFFHNPNGSLNSNAVMALLSGLGRAAEAPTVSPLGALISGVGAGSDTYRQLQKQAADIEQTKAQTEQTKIQSTALRFFKPEGGQAMVILPNGQPVSYWDFMSNPAMQSQFGPQEVASVRAQAAASGVAAPDAQQQGAVSNNIFSDKTGQAILAREGSYTNGPNYDAAIAQSAQIRAGVNADATSALGMHDNTVEQVRAISDYLAQPASMQPGALGEARAQIVKYVNSMLAGIPGFGPNYLGNADTDADVLNKIRTAAATVVAQGADQSSAQALMTIANGMPNGNITPDANAAIMANILVQQQKAIDKDRLYADYAEQTPGKTVFGAAEMFSRLNGRYDAERDAMQRLVKIGGTRSADGGHTVMELLTSGTLSPEEAQGLISTALGGNAPDGMYRYFIPYQAGG